MYSVYETNVVLNRSILFIAFGSARLERTKTREQLCMFNYIQLSPCTFTLEHVICLVVTRDLKYYFDNFKKHFVKNPHSSVLLI